MIKIYLCNVTKDYKFYRVYWDTHSMALIYVYKNGSRCHGVLSNGL